MAEPKTVRPGDQHRPVPTAQRKRRLEGRLGPAQQRVCQHGPAPRLLESRLHRFREWDALWPHDVCFPVCAQELVQGRPQGTLDSPPHHPPEASLCGGVSPGRSHPVWGGPWL